MVSSFYVYILASRHRTLYVGVTNDLMLRIAEHRQGMGGSFSKKYNVHELVYFETTSSIFSAITRERQIKGWRRSKKFLLIERANPKWRDLNADWQTSD